MKVKDCIVYLLRCSITNKKPNPDKLVGMDSNELFLYSQKHMISAIIASALEKAGMKDERFVQAKARAIRKTALLDRDREILFKELDNNKIWHMSLKGSVVKDLYPEYGTREMADYDILFDSTKTKELRDIMLGLGFQVESFGHGLHDVYHKKPVTNFEMHRMLCGPSDKRFYEYYRNVRERLASDEEHPYELHFTPEDCYVYLKAHEYKHYSCRGIGLRYLADTYLYLKKFDSQMDMAYVEQECAKLGIAEYEKTSRSLALNLFDGNPLSTLEKEMLEYIWESGAGGTSEHRVRNNIKGKGKAAGVRYLLGRIFIPMGKVKQDYPVIYKFRPLIVFLPGIRVIEAMTKHREIAKREVREAMKGR